MYVCVYARMYVLYMHLCVCMYMHEFIAIKIEV